MANTKNFIGKRGYSTGDGYEMPDNSPSLLLDFANSKVLDPRITFARGSTATYWDGYSTAKAEENIIQHSDFSDGWQDDGKSTQNLNNATSPVNTTTAAKINQASGQSLNYFYVQETIISDSSNVLTGSIYLKQGTQKYVYMQLITGSANTRQSILWDLNAGTQVGSDTEGSPQNVSHSLNPVGDGWFRCTITMDCVSGTSAYILVGMAESASPAWSGSALAPVSGDTAQNFYAWGPQLEFRDSVSTLIETTGVPTVKYQPTLQTAASGFPRFDHTPSTGESKGLLVESAVTNQYLNSVSTFSTQTGNTIRINGTGIAPDGTNNAQFVSSNGSVSSGYAYRGFSNIVGAGTWTISFYVKRLTGTANIQIGLGTNDSIYAIVAADMSVSGSVGSNTLVGTTSEEIGNGWYRCSVTATKTSAAAYGEYQGMSPGAYNSYLVWGTQIENQKFPTSLIPTGGSSVTRSAEEVYMEIDSNSEWYANEGTLYSKFSIDGFSTSQGAVSLYSTSINGNNWMGFFSSTPQTAGTNAGKASMNSTAHRSVPANSNSAGGGLTIASDSGTTRYFAAGEEVRAAMSFSTTEYHYGGNGAIRTNTGTFAIPSHTVLSLYKLYSGGFAGQKATIRKVAFYSTPMSVSELEQLTEE